MAVDRRKRLLIHAVPMFLAALNCAAVVVILVTALRR
jgi:hypothetical protein